MNDMWNGLLRDLKQGSIIALSRMITRVENREPGWMEAMKEIYPLTGKAKLIGITGSPGAGKSTLTNKIARNLVGMGYQIGIIAVDPSSLFPEAPSWGTVSDDRCQRS